MKKEEFKKSLKKITDFQTTITQKKQKQIQKKVIKVAESPIYGKKGFYRGEILNNKPNGYGIFIHYEKHKIRQKVLGISSQINHIYLGEWVNDLQSLELYMAYPSLCQLYQNTYFSLITQ